MNIELQHIPNPDVIKQVLSIDDIYKEMIGEELETWIPNLDTHLYLNVYRDNSPFGVIALEKFCSNGLVVHGGVFKTHRNKNTPEVFREIIRLVKEKTNKTVITYVCSNNIPCLKMMKKAGLIEKGTIPNASTKGNIIILMVE